MSQAQDTVKNANVHVAEALEACHEAVRVQRAYVASKVSGATVSLQKMDMILAMLDEEHASVALLIDSENEMLAVSDAAGA